jgi:hypothetical protein
MPLRKPLRKESEKAKAKREAEIAEVLEDAGAQTKDRSWQVEWVLKTTVGDLVIVPYEDWIHCKFDDPRAAGEVLGTGPHNRLHPTNGKWNWHNSYPQRTQAEHVQIIIDELRRYNLI